MMLCDIVKTRATQVAGPPVTFPPHNSGINHQTRLPLFALLLFVYLFAATGCTMNITQPREVNEPVKVYIADYGRHASLVVPAEKGEMIEFAYGQWDWFALNRNHWWNALYLIMFPAPGTLGMRHLPGEMSDEELHSELGAETLYTLRVDRAKALTLSNDLQRVFERRSTSLVKNPTSNMDFVRSPVTYSMWMENCNTILAEWLERLDCRVTGSRTHANFKIDG